MIKVGFGSGNTPFSLQPRPKELVDQALLFSYPLIMSIPHNPCNPFKVEANDLREEVELGLATGASPVPSLCGVPLKYIS